MKKKIKKFFEVGMMLAILLAFVLPGTATIIKPISSEETLGLANAELGWAPVDASGSHTIIGHEIFLHGTGQSVTLEIQVSGWSPHLLKAVQGTIDSAGYSNGVGGTLIPLGWPGTPEDGCFIDTTRSDYVFQGMVAVDAVYTGDLNYIWGAVLLTDSKADDGQTYYLGTLILEVPTNADGTYTIDFLPNVAKTFMQDNNGQNILPLILTPALITINQLPNAPTIDGPTSGSAGTSYTYTFNSVDPDGDDVKYFIDWGDGDTEWTGFSASGTPVTVSHTWAEEDTYIITAKAKDEYGLESDWATLEVEMPVNQQATNPLLQMILERFPNAFPLLRQLLGL